MGNCWQEHITATDSSCGWSQTKRQRMGPTVSWIQTRSGRVIMMLNSPLKKKTRHTKVANCIQVQKRNIMPIILITINWSIRIKRIGISYLIMFSLLIIQADGARMTRWRCQGSQHIWRRFWWREGSWLKSILTWPSNCYILILMADRWLWGTATWGNPDTPYLWHGPLGNLK